MEVVSQYRRLKEAGREKIRGFNLVPVKYEMHDASKDGMLRDV